MLTIKGHPRRLCSGFTRRCLISAGGAGLLGTSLTKLRAAEEMGTVVRPRAKSVLFLFLFGGPSQLETFDMKPDAPSGIRGPYQPVASRTPGLLVCEHLSKLAALSDKFAVDSHRHSDDVGKHLLPGLDQAFSALLEDLSDRGLLDETLVVCLGEMGRAPQGKANWGRDHWSYCFPAVLAGAGIRGGATYGRSDKDAAYPLEKPVSPENLAATIFHALGISPDTRIHDALGRPVPVMEGGQPLRELFG